MTQKNLDRSLLCVLFICALSLIIWQILATMIYQTIYPSLQVSQSFLASHKQFQYLLLCTAWLIPGACLLSRPVLSGRLQWVFAWIGTGVVFVCSAICLGFWITAGAGMAYALFRVYARRSTPEEESDGFSRFSGLRWLGFLLFSVALYAVVKPSCDYRVIDLYDDGPKLAAVQDYLRDRQPYRDFVVHYGPLRDIVQPLVAFHFWGVTYDAEQRIRAYIQAAGFVLMVWIVAAVSRRIGWPMVFGYVLFVRSDLFIPERVTPVLLAVFLMCLRLMLPDRLRSVRWLGISAGICSLLALLYSFEMGFTLILGTLATVCAAALVDRRSLNPRPWTDWAVGLAGAAAVWFLYLAMIGGLFAFISDTASLLEHRIGTWSDTHASKHFTFRPIRLWLSFKTFVYLHAVPLFSCLVAAIVLWKRKAGERQSRDLALLLLSVTLFVQYLIYMSRADIIHWQNATGLLWPFIALVLFELWQWFTSSTAQDISTRWLTVMAAAPLSLFLFTWLCGRSPLWLNTVNAIERGVTPRYQPSSSMPQIERMGPITGAPSEMAEIQAVTEWIQKEVGREEPLFLFVREGGYYFLTDRLNPTRYGLVDMVQGERMLQDCLQALMRQPPKAVLVQLHSTQSVVWEYRPDLKPIADFLEARYREKYRHGNLAVLVPR